MNVKVLRHARIYTGDLRYPWAQALAIVDGKVAAWDSDALAWGESVGAVVEDLEGALVLPGLIDAHVHLMWYALSLKELDLRGLSKEQLLTCLAERGAHTPAGSWIRGRGWDQNLWPDGRFPTAADLDSVVSHAPVLLTAKNAHAAVANTLALQLAGIRATTPDPDHGRLGRSGDGSPDGMLFERAIEMVLSAIPEPDPSEVAASLDEVQEHLLAAGLTGIHDVDAGPAFAAFQKLHQEDRLKVRVVKYIQSDALEGALAVGLRSGFGTEMLRFGGLKLFADGALGARTAALFAPYEGEPENTGALTLEPEQLRGIVQRAVKGGMAVEVHAIGDRAVHEVLNAFEDVRPDGRGLRHRVEHVQLISPGDLPRMTRLGVIASMQPVHATHDWAMAERYWGTRTAFAYPWLSLLRAGVPLAFGSDAPIESFNPLLGLYAAVTRRHEADGSPGPDGWHPEQRLTLVQAVKAYTRGAAYAAGMEGVVGTLSPGLCADLVVLDCDIFELPPEALLEARVLRTMVGGTWQF